MWGLFKAFIAKVGIMALEKDGPQNWALASQAQRLWLPRSSGPGFLSGYFHEELHVGSKLLLGTRKETFLRIRFQLSVIAQNFQSLKCPPIGTTKLCSSHTSEYPGSVSVCSF